MITWYIMITSYMLCGRIQMMNFRIFLFILHKEGVTV